MNIIEPKAYAYDPEYRMLILSSPNIVIIALSGQVNINVGQIVGNEDDSVVNNYLVKLKVGPYWKSINRIIPQVSITGFANLNSDSDNELRWSIHKINHKLVRATFNNISTKELEINFLVDIKGESSTLFNLSYQVICEGTLDAAFDLNDIDLLRLPGKCYLQGAVSRQPFDYMIPPYKTKEFNHSYRVNSSEINYVIRGSHAVIQDNVVAADSYYIQNYYEFVIDPEFEDISDATIFLNINGYTNTNPDEDETRSWGLTSSKWEKSPMANSNKFKLKISTDLGLSGVSSVINEISYLIFAKAKAKLNPAVSYIQPHQPITKIATIDDLLPPNEILIPLANEEREYRLSHPIISNSDNLDHVVFSRSIDVTHFNIKGSQVDDHIEQKHTFCLETGPSMRRIESVVPHLYISDFESLDSDEDDELAYGIIWIDMYLVGGFGPGKDEFKVFLRGMIGVKGVASQVKRLSYTISVIGKLGEKGLK